MLLPLINAAGGSFGKCAASLKVESATTQRCLPHFTRFHFRCLRCTSYPERITNTDFASQWHADDYPHPKQSTLVLRYRDDSKVEHIYKPCDDSKRGTQNYQYWPSSDQPADMMWPWNIHEIEAHYERRLMKTPSSVRGPLLDYTSVTVCHDDKIRDISRCLNRYDGGMNGLEGVSGDNWKPLATMSHVTNWDEDTVYVLKNDQDKSRRRCIISFKGSDSLFGDLSNFFFDSPSAYCGKDLVQNGACFDSSRLSRKRLTKVHFQ